MRTRKLGSRGPDISVIGYGAWELGGMWGPGPAEDEVIAAMHAGFDAGIGWVDTAEVYGNGASEELVGRALAGYEHVMAFTKVAPRPVGSGFHPDGVRRALEQSLKRLGRDAIDLYQLHWPDHEGGTPVEQTWETMAALVDEGSVRSIGVSNFDEDLIRRCERVRHVDSLQPQFSMLHRKGRHDLFPFCEENGTGIICYGPLAYGLLTGAITAETEFEESDWRSGSMGMSYYDNLFAPGKIERNLAIVGALRPIAARLGIELSQLALAWAFHQRGVTGAIAGSRSASHVVENARAGDVALSATDLEEIEAVLTSS
jgi:aryl-alcohol dehydrogenase-like predicted oxidoreductase